MPHRDREARNRYMREYRARQRRKREAARVVETAATLPGVDPIDSLAAWSFNTLKVPAGHPRAGEPMVLPDYGRRFLADALTHREALLCMGRKNAKSALTAVYLLGRLVGPLAVDGWRGAVCSVNRGKAAELKEQCEAIAKASGLDGLTFRRSPAPGRVEGPRGALDVLSADRTAGHASGFDDVVIDETGLLQERDRALVNGLRSSTSARDGRILHLTIEGDGPYVPELLTLADDPAVTVHHYRAPDGCALDDEAAWHEANPGMAAGIKSRAYMADRARMAAANPNDQADFRAHDLNQPGSGSTETLCTVADFDACLAGDTGAPERRGPVVVGLDAGGSASMTAAVAWWIETGRVEARGAFPAAPDLVERGAADGVGDRYRSMERRGELRVYPGRTTPVSAFLADFNDEVIAGAPVIAAGADRYRRAEVSDYLAGAGLRWPMHWRGQGASATADGSADVRAAQRAILDRRAQIAGGVLLMVSAIVESVIRRDPLGNPALDKSRARGRIDPLSAFVIAAGLAERAAPRLAAASSETARVAFL